MVADNMGVDKIRAFNRPAILVVFMIMVCVLVWLKVDKNTLIAAIGAVGTPIGFYLGIKGKGGPNGG